MEPNFKATNVGKGLIEPPALTKQYYPTELFLKEDGALGNKPSFALLLHNPYRIEGNQDVLGQISLETLQKAFDDLGYSLKKKEE